MIFPGAQIEDKNAFQSTTAREEEQLEALGGPGAEVSFSPSQLLLLKSQHAKQHQEHGEHNFSSNQDLPLQVQELDVHSELPHLQFQICLHKS